MYPFSGCWLMTEVESEVNGVWPKIQIPSRKPFFLCHSVCLEVDFFLSPAKSWIIRLNDSNYSLFGLLDIMTGVVSVGRTSRKKNWQMSALFVLSLWLTRRHSLSSGGLVSGSSRDKRDWLSAKTNKICYLYLLVQHFWWEKCPSLEQLEGLAVRIWCRKSDERTGN